MRTSLWLWCGALVAVLGACGGDDFSVSGDSAGTAGGAGEAGGGTAGGAGTSIAGGTSGGGQSGEGGSAGAGAGGTEGGSAGSTSGGSAGASGEGGSAGQGGDAGSAGASGGTAGAAGQGGAAGASGMGGGAGNAGAAGAAGSPNQDDCSVVYVAPDGDDVKNTGCKKSPVATLKKAMDVVGTKKLSEVHLCAGAFDGHTEVATSVTIIGSYDCSTWQSLLPDTFDPATDADKIKTQLTNSKTAIIFGNIDPQSHTLQVRGGSKVSLQGLDISAHQQQSATSWAIDARDNATTLSVDRCRLDGGGGQDKDNVGSVGLEVGNGVLASVTRSAIRGGKGTSKTGIGSAGVLIDKGAAQPSQPVSLDHVVIDGGSGVSDGDSGSPGLAQGSVAVLSLGPVKVSSGELRGGTGSVFYGVASVALSAIAKPGDPAVVFDVSDTLLDGGNGFVRPKGPGDTLGGSSYGLFGLNTVGTMTRSRVYGGDAYLQTLPSDTAHLPNTIGVLLTENSSATLTDNLIVGGNLTKKTGLGSARAVLLLNGSKIDLLHNTLLGGTAVNANTNPVALFVGITSSVNRFENNLLGVSDVASQDGFSSYNIFLEGCPDKRFSTFVGNAFLPARTAQLAAYYVNGSTSCTTTGQVTGVLGSSGELSKANVSPVIQDNLLVSGSCEGLSDCVSVNGCDGPTSCQMALFDTKQDLNLNQLTKGFMPLSSGLPCKLVKHDKSLADPAVASDARGTKRTDPVTPGAIEQDSCQ